MAGRRSWWRRVRRVAAGAVLGAATVTSATAFSSELSGAASAPWPTATVSFGPCQHDGVALAMDLYLPAPSSVPARAPVVLFVHGGGWAMRRRSQGPLFAEITAGLNRRGIAVASPDYRLAPDHRWPAPLDDLDCALAEIVRGAPAWNLDPTRVGAWGVSAGGHLVSLLGTRPAVPPSPAPGPAPPPARSPVPWLAPGGAVRLDAVVDLYGPADLGAPGWPVPMARLIAQEFGSSPAVLRAASPQHRVGAEDPPILVVHGDADRTVPLAQSERFALALERAGVPAELVVVPGGTHGLGDRPELVGRVTTFLAERLSPAPAPP